MIFNQIKDSFAFNISIVYGYDKNRNIYQYYSFGKRTLNDQHNYIGMNNKSMSLVTI